MTDERPSRESQIELRLIKAARIGGIIEASANSWEPDIRYLIEELKSAREKLALAERVVEAAREFVGDHGYCSGNCGACGTVKALAAYDAALNQGTQP